MSLSVGSPRRKRAFPLSVSVFFFFFFNEPVVRRYRVQLETVRAAVVGRVGGRGAGRGGAAVRPADGPDRGAVDRAADVPVAAAVLREDPVAARPAEAEGGRGRVLPHVSGRPAGTRGRRRPPRAPRVPVVHRAVGHRCHRAVHRDHRTGHGRLRQVHAVVRDAMVRRGLTTWRRKERPLSRVLLIIIKTTLIRVRIRVPLLHVVYRVFLEIYSV